MNRTKYIVTCTKCKASRELAIIKEKTREIVDWLETPQTMFSSIISTRKRFDDKRGFQCKCGNNDMITKQEKRVIKDQTNPQPREISEIMNNLKQEPITFKMQEIK